jgi:hypothetical protein
MYVITLKSGQNNVPRIYVEGRLDNCEEIRKEIDDILKVIDKQKIIVIDFHGVESISEECFSVFHKLFKEYPIVLENYSLFVEHQLRAHNLVEDNQMPSKNKNNISIKEI